jgi:hypothetical protein
MEQTVSMKQTEHNTPAGNAPHLLNRVLRIIDETETGDGGAVVETLVGKREGEGTPFQIGDAAPQVVGIVHGKRIGIDPGHFKAHRSEAACKVAGTGTYVEQRGTRLRLQQLVE